MLFDGVENSLGPFFILASRNHFLNWNTNTVFTKFPPKQLNVGRCLSLLIVFRHVGICLGLLIVFQACK